MQLTIEVLPAPFGPMMENSSPSLTPKLTSVSARTPPKRNETPRTSRLLATLFPPDRGALARSLSSLRSYTSILHGPPEGDHPTNEAGVREHRSPPIACVMRGNAAPRLQARLSRHPWSAIHQGAAR